MDKDFWRHIDIKKVAKGIDKRAKEALKGLEKANKGKDAERAIRMPPRAR